MKTHRLQKWLYLFNDLTFYFCNCILGLFQKNYLGGGGGGGGKKANDVSAMGGWCWHFWKYMGHWCLKKSDYMGGWVL